MFDINELFDNKSTLERNKEIAHYSLQSSMSYHNKNTVKLAAFRDIEEVLWWRQIDPEFGEDVLDDINKLIPYDA